MSASERLKAKKKGTIGKEVNKVEDSLLITKSIGCYVVTIGRGAGQEGDTEHVDWLCRSVTDHW